MEFRVLVCPVVGGVAFGVGANVQSCRFLFYGLIGRVLRELGMASISRP